MERSSGLEITPKSEKSLSFLKEQLLLSEMSNSGIKIVPGSGWKYHYPISVAERMSLLSSALSGDSLPQEQQKLLVPDAITFPSDELVNSGFDVVAAKLRDMLTFAEQYNPERCVQWCQSLADKEGAVEMSQLLFDEIEKSRIRKKTMDVLGQTGRNQLQAAMKREVKALISSSGTFQSLDKILQALKLQWLSQYPYLVDLDQIDEFIDTLNKEELKIYQELLTPYIDYVEKGEKQSSLRLIEGIQSALSKQTQEEGELSNEVDDSIASAEQKQLHEELKEYLEQNTTQPSPGDLSIPQEDSDEYQTPPQQQSTEQLEQLHPNTLFEIRPSGTSREPLLGYYAVGRKSYYDISTKTWSKKKQLRLYTDSLAGSERQTITGVINQGITALPIPVGYAIDGSSLQYTSSTPSISRDQNGCFYLQSEGRCGYSIDFLKEQKPFVSGPISEDVESLYLGSLSPETEQIISDASGGVLERAEYYRRFLLSKHEYPEDLKVAHALQIKLRAESTGDNYIQNLEASKFLECYSANTLFIAMLRKGGIPARLVLGYKVDKVNNGKIQITSGNGHAWTEVWDGFSWRRMDATPLQQNQQQNQQSSGQGEQGKQAEDGGIEPENDQDQKDEKKKVKREN